MTAGSLSTLLHVKPAIEAGLKDFVNKHAQPHRITPRQLWHEFSALCISSGVAAEEFPRCVPDHGRRAVMKWFNAVYLVKLGTTCTRPNSGRNAASHVFRRSE